MSVSSLFPSKNNIFRPNYSLEVSYALFVKPVPKKNDNKTYINMICCLSHPLAPESTFSVISGTDPVTSTT